MIATTRGGYGRAAVCAMHPIAPNAAVLQGTGVSASTAITTDAFGPVWRLRGKRATAEPDSAPPLPA